GQVERGVAICGSGVGAAMVANRIPGARACLITDTYAARQGVEHDAMNVLCLGGRITGVELVKEILTAYLAADFSGEARHARRLEKMRALEEEGRKTGN
ncbi:MAG: RpiB/LacA/LacB family sugar-phosphate isomerase, partial [Catalinimonas sp.]